MTIVVDVARTVLVPKQAHNTAMQLGNDYPDTVTPTWLDTITFLAGIPELHISARADVTPWVGTPNIADAWVPHTTLAWLPSVPATVHF
jgi:hypothetical protein